MSWVRGVLSGAVVVVVAFVALVWVPNFMLVRLTSLSRSTREYVCVLWFGLALVVLLFALRRLQAHRVI